MSCGFCAVTPVSNCPVCGTAGTDPKNAPAVNVPIRSAKGRSAQRRYGQTRAARNAAALRNAIPAGPSVQLITTKGAPPAIVQAVNVAKDLSAGMSAAEASFQNTRRALMSRLEALGLAAMAKGDKAKAAELRRLWYAARDSKFTSPAPTVVDTAEAAKSWAMNAPGVDREKFNARQAFLDANPDRHPEARTTSKQVETLRPVSPPAPALPYALPNECVDYKAANPDAVCDDAARRAFEASKASGPLTQGDWAGLYARVAAGTMTDDEAKRIGHEWIHGKAEKETPAAPNMPAAQA